METLRLWGCYGHLVTDDWMKQVRAFKNLRNLVLDNAAISDKGLAELKGLTNLQSLYLNRATKITNAALKEIKQFKNLQDLNLGFTGYQPDTAGNAGTLHKPWFGRADPSKLGVTDAGMKELKEFKTLQTLNLAYTKVTAAGLRDLKELRNLRTVELFVTQIKPAELKELQKAMPETKFNVHS